MEYFDILDSEGNPTGSVKERSEVHRDGDLHGTVHTWILRPNKSDRTAWDVLLQKRSSQKDAFPGCFDIASAGHISAGQAPQEAVLRELEEELGLRLSLEDLTLIGRHEGYTQDVFYGIPFRNHELSWVYVHIADIDTRCLSLQQEEVAEVCWIGGSELLQALQQQDSTYCIYLDEYEAVLQAVKDMG